MSERSIYLRCVLRRLDSSFLLQLRSSHDNRRTFFLYVEWVQSLRWQRLNYLCKMRWEWSEHSEMMMKMGRKMRNLTHKSLQSEANMQAELDKEIRERTFEAHWPTQIMIREVHWYFTCHMTKSKLHFAQFPHLWLSSIDVHSTILDLSLLIFNLNQFKTFMLIHEVR